MRSSITSRKIRKILIRSTNWIGDAVMTTPAMGAVRACFPDAEIVVAANPLVAQLFSPHPHCDGVLAFDKKNTHKGLGGLFSFAGELRQKEFDLAILFQNAVEAAIVAFLAGIPMRAGYRTDCRGLLLTHGVPVGNSEKALHHTAYYLKMLESLGIQGGNGRLNLTCTDEEHAWAEGVLGDAPWIAINPGATYGSAKRWFPQRFSAVADAVIREFGSRVLLVGSPAEREIGNEIERAMSFKPLNFVGKTSVRQLMALLAGCRMLITNDSGPMHVAAALGTPVAALFGSTDHTTTSPLSNAVHIVRKPVDCSPCLKRTCPTDHRCMEAITVEDVLQAVRGLMKEEA